MLMNLKNRTLLTEKEYDKEIQNIKKKYSKGISKHCLLLPSHTHTHTQTHIYIYIYIYCDGKLLIIPKWDFIFARVKTGQVGT